MIYDGNVGVFGHSNAEPKGIRAGSTEKSIFRELFSTIWAEHAAITPDTQYILHRYQTYTNDGSQIVLEKLSHQNIS